MIYRKCFAVLPLLVILLFCQYPQSIASENGYSQYGNFVVDFSGIDADKTRKEADEYFVKAFDSQTQDAKIKYYGLAMHSYYVLSKIYPNDYYAYVQIARIHDERNDDNLAKKNYFHAFNLDKNNPYTNFYFAEYHIKRAMYQKALKYYLIAYNNGYNDNYITNLKLAQLYEKLGDLKKSEELYKKSNKINPNNVDTKTKIQSLEALNYENSEYYHFIRE